MSRLSLAPVQPNEAIAYFRAKGFKTSFAWQDVWQAEHAKAFTVAKAMSRDVLQDIRDAVDRALVNGTTLQQFRKELEPTLKAKGWWGQQPMVDPLTGEERMVQLGSGQRLETIFNTNLRTAYAAGLWQRLQRTKSTFPYLRYTAVMDDRTRPQHREWHGTTLPIDDPWWDEHYPPCGFNCRCTVRALTRSMAEREPKWGKPPTKFPPTTYRNPRTGERVRMEEGISPGWAYNVGKAYLEPLTPPPVARPPADIGSRQERLDARRQGEQEPPLRPSEAEKGSPTTETPGELPEPIELPADELLGEDVGQAQAESTFLEGFGVAGGGTVTRPDASGDSLVVGPALFRDSAGRPVALSPSLRQALPLIGQAMREPAEIRAVWREGPPRPDGVLSMLVRRFIARFDVAGRQVDVVVDVGNAGWSARTSLDDAGLNLDDWRRGIVLWPPEADRR